jgi:hypothetical protein
MGGIVVAWFGIVAAMRELPSEIASSCASPGLRLRRSASMLLTIVFGLWLVFDLDFGLWDG